MLLKCKICWFYETYVVNCGTGVYKPTTSMLNKLKKTPLGKLCKHFLILFSAVHCCTIIPSFYTLKFGGLHLRNVDTHLSHCMMA
jgi:hypothetical protein